MLSAQPLLRRIASTWALPVVLAMSAANANIALAADVRVPSNVNFKRLQLLERADPDPEHKLGQMKIYVLVKGETTDGQVLLSRKDALRQINIDLFRQMLMNRVKELGRFDVYNHDVTSVMDQTSLVLEARVVEAVQSIENLVVVRKAITRVGLSVNITDIETGNLLRAKTTYGRYGSEPGEGTVIISEAELRSPTVQESLLRDYQQALKEAVEEVASYLESRYRPVGRIKEVQAGQIAIDGGELHGFNDGDPVVVFRTRFSMVNGELVPGIMTGIARARCESINERTSTCRLASGWADSDVRKGDYVMLDYGQKR